MVDKSELEGGLGVGVCVAVGVFRLEKNLNIENGGGRFRLENIHADDY